MTIIAIFRSTHMRRGGLNRGVNISCAAFGGLSDHGACRRVDIRKCPSMTRRDEGAANQQLA